MRNIPTKTDFVSTLPATDYNANESELENAVTSTGQSLDAAGGPDSDLFMLGKAMAVYGGDAGFYEDSGAADAYVLSRTDSLQSPPAYFDGMKIAFIPDNDNTGASTVNVATLGVKNITKPDGTVLVAGEIEAGEYTFCRYSVANSRFELLSVFLKKILDNNTALRGKEVGGTIRELIKIDSSDEVSVGDANIPTVVKGSGSTVGVGNDVIITPVGDAFVVGELKVGKDGAGNSILWLYDDTEKDYRFLVWNNTLRVWQIEDVGGISREIVTTTGTQTLTNKSLTSPTITGTGSAAFGSLTVANLTFAGNTIGSSSGNVVIQATGLTQIKNTLRVGDDGLGDSIIEFHDDDNDTWRTLKWDDSSSEWQIEDLTGTQILWHSGNDGPGSGLDADTVDGTHLAGLLTVTEDGSKWPSFSVTKDATVQSIPDSTWRKVSWQDEEFDTNSDFVTDAGATCGASTCRFTPTVAGKYMFTAAALLTSLVADKTFQIALYKNGVLSKTFAIETHNTANRQAAITCIEDANGSTDYFEIFVWHDMGAAKNLTSTASFTNWQGSRIA
jgi:hypothetical protein